MTFKDCLTGQLAKAKGEKKKLKAAIDRYERAFAEKQLTLGDFLAADEVARDMTQALQFDLLAKQKIALRSAEAQQRILANMTGYVNRKGEADPAAALMAHIEADQVGRFQNFSTRFEVIKGQYHAGIENFLQRFAVKGAGLVKPVKGLDNIARELFGEGTGDKSAKELAEAVADTMEQARLRANAAGASIPKKDKWGMPQNHDRVKVAKAGKAEWVANIRDKLDWSRMRDPETGATVSATDRDALLAKIYDTIKTEGLVKLEPRAGGGGGAMATRLHQRRFLEFKGADAWLSYHNQYGYGSVFDVVVNHLDHMARDTAMMEVFGPNPEASRRFMMQAAQKQAADLDAASDDPATRLYTEELGKKLRDFNTMWDVATGANSLAQGDLFGHSLAGMRNLISSSFLGASSLLAIPGDAFTTALTRKFNGLPATRFIGQYLKQMNPANAADRRLAVRSGLVAESATQVAFAQQRMLGEVLGPEVTRRFADVVLRMSLLTPHTDAMRHAFGLEMMGDFADKAATPFAELPEYLQNAFGRYDISPEDWDIMRATKAYSERGATFLRPYDILKRKKDLGDRAQMLADKFMGFILTEREFAVPTTSIRARATLVGDTRPGTVAGEIIRSFAQFKNFPVTILLLHGRRGLLRSSLEGKAAYLAAFGIGMTMTGALGMQMKMIAAGKDPVSMDPTEENGVKFWGAAMLSGGGLGIWGDFLFSNVNRYGGSLQETIAGPAAGTISDIRKLTIGNAINVARGEPTQAGREALQAIEKYSPKPFYLRLAMQRLIFDQLAKEADPKAEARFRRMERNAYKETGQRYWWRPGQAAPQRSPDIGAIAGD